jgi:signal transduction histidine kinase/ligand-binding sensor domain-containing protein
VHRDDFALYWRLQQHIRAPGVSPGSAGSGMERFARFPLRVAGLLCGAFLALQPAAARALDPARLITQYGLDVWLTRDGLPQNSVKAIVQTRDGYLWLGTWGGLARFDGVRFTIFNRANTPALGDNRITALAEGADGSLWIGTAQAGLIRLKDGVFESYRSESDTSYEERSRWQIRSIAPSRDGGLWIGTSGSGFRRFKDGRFGPLLMDRHVVGTILEDTAGHLWVQTRDDVLELEWNDRATFQVLRQLPNVRFSDIYQDRVGTIWIAHRQGLTRVSGGRVTTFGRAEGFPADAALSIWGDRDGNLWIGTNGDGLVRMRGEQFDVLTVRDGLSNGFIAALYEDREGSLWIGSNDGLNRLRDTRFTAITAREGLSVDAVNSIVAGRDGTVWISTDGGGLNRLQAGRITTYTTADGLPANYIGALFEASDGSLWISGDGVVIQLRNGRFRVYTRADGVPAGFVSAIGETRRGVIVMCGEGPARELKDGRFVLFGQEPARMEYCYSITRDRRGDLWFATTGGLVHVSSAGPRLYTTRDGLPDEGVHSIHEDEAGAIWIPTVSGLALLKNGRVTSFSKLGPLGEVVFEILEDDAGYLWMNGRQGILKAAKSDLEAYAAGQRRDVTIGVYGLMDGLKSTEYNAANAAYIQRPASRTPDGRLWFATTQGIVSIDPSVDWLNRLPPPLAIETFVADGQADARRPLEVAAGTSTFEIHYTALSLVAPSRVRFAYQLEGLDPRWIDAGTRRVALYSRVPPGQYRFHLRAANNDGLWNDAGATLDIRVLPYFYQTLWFRLSGVAVGALAIFGLHRMRMRRVETRFALVMKERNRIAREIHDTLAQGLAGIGLHLAAIEHEPSAESREQHVGTARRLVKASLAEAHRSVWNLRPEYLDHSTLVTGLGRMATDLSEGGDMHIEVSTSGIARPLSPAVETNVFRIAQEAVANAIRHADARRIRVRLEFERDAVRLTVDDDGHGFDPAASSDGFGLTSMRERAAQIGALLRVEGRSSAGASVTLSVPVEPAEGRGVMARVAKAVRGGRQPASRLPALVPNVVRAIGSRARRWLSRLSH